MRNVGKVSLAKLLAGSWALFTAFSNANRPTPSILRRFRFSPLHSKNAWQSVAQDGIDLGPHTDAARDTLAKGIIHAAQRGERDRRNLRDSALVYLAEASVRKAAE